MIVINGLAKTRHCKGIPLSQVSNFIYQLFDNIYLFEHFSREFRRDILFGPIYDRFQQDSIAKGVFLECLEPYILNDTLTSITPGVMKDFVDHYKTKEMVHSVEACIVHMDIASLDIHQVKDKFIAASYKKRGSIFVLEQETLGTSYQR